MLLRSHVGKSWEIEWAAVANSLRQSLAEASESVAMCVSGLDNLQLSSDIYGHHDVCAGRLEPVPMQTGPQSPAEAQFVNPE